MVLTDNFTRHIDHINVHAIHSLLGLSPDESCGLTIAEAEGRTLQLRLRYSIRHGKNLRKVLGNPRYTPDGLNSDVWSQVAEYLGAMFRMECRLVIYLNNLHDFWEPIWVAEHTRFRIDGLKEEKYYSFQLRLHQSIVVHMRSVNKRNLTTHRLDPPVLEDDYDNLTSDVCAVVLEVTQRLHALQRSALT